MSDNNPGPTWPTIPIEKMNIRLIANFGDITNLGQGMDIFTALLGRFGVDQFALLITDIDDESRQWVLQEGVLMTPEEYEAWIDAEADAAAGGDDDDDEETDEDEDEDEADGGDEGEDE